MFVDSEYPKMNSQGRIALAELYNLDQGSHFTPEELLALLDGVWPGRTMTVYGLGHYSIDLETYDETWGFSPTMPPQ